MMALVLKYLISMSRRLGKVVLMMTRPAEVIILPEMILSTLQV